MSGWTGKRVLVTGAGGFIGSHLVEELVRGGAAVRAFVRYNARAQQGHLEQLPADVRSQLEVVLGHIEDPYGVARAVERSEVVFHLAALIGIPYSYLAPKSYVDTNVMGTLNVLEAARAAGAGRVVHTSTSEVYGTAQATPMDEGHPLQAQSPYSASKAGADALAESYWRSFGVPVTTLRPFNAFGPRQSLRAVIPTIVAQALAGDEVRLGSLEPVRDFSYVSDTVAAFLAVGAAPGVEGTVFNAGSGRGIAIGALARIVLELIDSDARLVADDERVRPGASEVLELRADASRLRETTGWAPRVSLREGLERTIAWQRGHAPGVAVSGYAV